MTIRATFDLEPAGSVAVLAESGIAASVEAVVEALAARSAPGRPA